MCVKLRRILAVDIYESANDFHGALSLGTQCCLMQAPTPVPPEQTEALGFLDARGELKSHGQK